MAPHARQQLELTDGAHKPWKVNQRMPNHKCLVEVSIRIKVWVPKVNIKCGQTGPRKAI